MKLPELAAFSYQFPLQPETLTDFQEHLRPTSNKEVVVGQKGMQLKRIDKTAVVAWGPNFPQSPYLAVGTVAGALDASFSTNSELELYRVNLGSKTEEPKRVAVIPTTARFNRLAWSSFTGPDQTNSFQDGVIAGGMEDGTVVLWDAGKLMASPDSSLIVSKQLFQGPVRGLHFNPTSPFLLGIGSVDGQISLMDLNSPARVYAPGPTKSARIEDVTGLAWNPKYGHILAACSSNGYSTVWDLRSKREVIQFSVPGIRCPLSGVSWNPDLPNQLITASEDNASPNLYLWDLRNAHAPEKILQGHAKGVLSVAWCPKDSELLMSSGKDNRAIFWNPKTAVMVGELPARDNWAFEVQWCPRNPDLLSIASFDGTVDIFSYQSVSSSVQAQSPATAGSKEDLFSGQSGHSLPAHQTQESVKQVPKWLRCPVGVRFGFGGKLALFSSAANPKQVTLISVSDHLKKGDDTSTPAPQDLEKAVRDGSAAQYCLQKAKTTIAPGALRTFTDQDAVLWSVLSALHEADPHQQLLKLAGVSQETYSSASSPSETVDVSVTSASANEVMHPSTASTAIADAGSFRPSAEPTPTALMSLDLFSPSAGPSDEFDFLAAEDTHTHVQQTQQQQGGLERRSTFSGLPFSLYTKDSSSEEQKITRAIITGNFSGAVDACIAADRLSDALLVSVCGGPELVSRTQRIYFQRVRSPYLRVVSGVLKRDLSDVVENAALDDWADLFALVLSFSLDSLSKLMSVLADRLALEAATTSRFTVPAIVCYLVAGETAKASALLLKLSNKSKPQSRDQVKYSEWLSATIEKVRLTCLTKPEIGLDKIVSDLPELGKLLLAHSFNLAEGGRTVEAVYYLSLVLPSLSLSSGVSSSVGLFADRLAHARADLSVPKPFTLVDVPLYSEPQRQVTPDYQQPQQQHFTPPSAPAPAPAHQQHQQPSAYQTVYGQQPTAPYSQSPYQQQSYATPYQQSATPYGHQSIQGTAPYQQQQAVPSARPSITIPSAGIAHTPVSQPSPQQYYGIAQPQQQSLPRPPTISASEFSARRTTEGFNDAPIVAAKPVAVARSPVPAIAQPQQPPSQPQSQSHPHPHPPSAPQQQQQQQPAQQPPPKPVLQGTSSLVSIMRAHVRTTRAGKDAPPPAAHLHLAGSVPFLL